MKTLDRYILGKLLITFVFCMLLFTAIAVAIDTSEKADDFAKLPQTAFQIFTDYYFGFIPFIWSLLYPLFVFIAVIFFTSKMALRSEIIAILASGTTYWRFLRPYIVGGIILALVLMYGKSFVIPKAITIYNDFKKTYLDKDDPFKNRQEGTCWNCFYRRVSSDTYISVKEYNPETQTSGVFSLEKIKNNKVIFNLRAKSITWDTAAKGWKAQSVVERQVDSLGERVTLVADRILKLNITPDEMANSEYLKDQLSTPALIKLINKEEKRGTEGLNSLKVELHKRFSAPFTVLLLTFIGAVIASRKTRGGSGLHLAVGIIIAAVFIIADQFSTVFSVKGNFPPVLAAWIPNMFFSIVAIYLYRKTPK
ncbi:MAG: YjgP/YjgQ family permease [Bacteroidia bacterium]|nr:MAG: YjgP/YjgQ family permease [Bacteroidia bacterium]